MKNKLPLIILIAVFFIFIAGCSNIHVGGSGRVGDVTGSGGVDIPVPQKDRL